MISSIDKLENLGIYSNFSKNAVQDFKRYNLIYGWNGSGKSTLSRLFALIGGQKISAEYGQFKAIVTVDGQKYCETQFPLTNENILVFNEDFIKDNIDWDGTIKNILLLDEENILQVGRYTALKEELYGKDNKPGLIEQVEKKRDKLKHTDNELQKILTNIGKTVKTHFLEIGAQDTYYSNYDKRNVSSLINNRDYPLSEQDELTDLALRERIKEAKPNKKERINQDVAIINTTDIETLIEHTKEIITRKVVAKVIEELREDPALSNWVEQGIQLHKPMNRATCAFCGAKIDASRYDDLEAHFSDALNRLNSDITLCVENWQEYKQNEEEDYIAPHLFYAEFEEKIQTDNEIYREAAKGLNHEIDQYIKILESKKATPFDTVPINVDSKEIIERVKDVKGILTEFQAVISAHNAKSDSFEEHVTAAKKKLERHYVQSQMRATDYNKKQKDYLQAKQKIEEEERELKEKQEEYAKVEASLSSETLGAEEFNQKLEVLLGYDEIKLKFDSQAKGYRICRNMQQEATNLSEGEKTAIAFIYYMTKLKENGRKVDDCILVIDDPVSSFDSNKLFASYAYLKSECDNVKQLFVLTHNYNYFSLVLGWFNKKHKQLADEQSKREPDYAIYRVENKFEQNKRVAILQDGGESLKQETEYDYVFDTVYSMKDRPLSKNESVFCGNVCRKLVESFLSFKFPKQRADLAALLKSAFPEDAIIRERIYRFVNVYSHDKKINVFEELDTDILDASSRTVINDILSMIERLDKVHYDAMVDKISKEFEE